jgi:hypothetical protein
LRGHHRETDRGRQPAEQQAAVEQAGQARGDDQRRHQRHPETGRQHAHERLLLMQQGAAFGVGIDLAAGAAAALGAVAAAAR